MLEAREIWMQLLSMRAGLAFDDAAGMPCLVKKQLPDIRVTVRGQVNASRIILLQISTHCYIQTRTDWVNLH